MSVKKRSFLCKIVHKMVENARFFAQKRTFLHIFAGGRGDFLAGPKSGFWGVRASRERPRPRPVFCFEKTPRRTTFLLHCKNIKEFIMLHYEMLSAGECASHAPLAHPML